MAFRLINWELLKIMSENQIPHQYDRHNKGLKTMPFWANIAKEVSTTISSEKNLQKLGSKTLTEVNSRIDFNEARYFVGENQDSFVFNPTQWTEVKGTNGYTPTLTPSLIHFTRKEFKGFGGVNKEVTPKDKFFTEQLSKLMESGKTYYGFIDTSIPDAMITMIQDPNQAAIVNQLLTPYISVTEVTEPTLFTSLAISESRSGFSGNGYSKGETEAEKIASRKEAIKALAVEMFGENAQAKDYMDNAKFAAYASLVLGLPLPSNLSLTF